MLKLRRAEVVRLARDWTGPQGVRPGAPPRRALDIEDLLRWAYREELPKAGRPLPAPALPQPGWFAVGRYAELLADIDLNEYGVAPLSISGDAPHDDARRVAAAVEGLAALDLDLPADWSPLADMGDLGQDGAVCCARALARLTHIDADGVRRLKATPGRLVIKHAILGGCPDWRAEAPRRDFVRSAGGGHPQWFVRREIWSTDAFGRDICEEVEAPVSVDERSRRPPVGAYRKAVLIPDPTDAAVARAEYEVWRAALDVLAADLDGALAEYAPVASRRARRPWETPEATRPTLWVEGDGEVGEATAKWPGRVVKKSA